MASKRVGLEEAVKAALERRDASRRDDASVLWGRIECPLAELIEVDRTHASAVEAALGASLQALIVDRVDPDRDALALHELAGRVTFLSRLSLINL